MKNEFLSEQLTNAMSGKNVVTHEKRLTTFKDKHGNVQFEHVDKPRINTRFTFNYDIDGRDTQPPASEKGKYPNRVTQKKAHQK